MSMERSLAAYSGGIAPAGGAKLVAGRTGSTVCTGGDEKVVSHAMPEFIGKTSGIGAFAARRAARHRMADTVAAAKTAKSSTATT
jgi:hypothetical protein